MPNWKKVIVSGSDANLNSLNVTAGVTGSLLGSASYASSASYALSSTSASYAATASYVLNAISSSYASSASYYGGSVVSASYASTASFVNGNYAYIGGALYQTKTTSIGTGTNTIFTFSTATTTFTSAFVEYYISNGASARSGQIQVAYLASQTTFNETATMDIGNTDNFVWNVVMSGVNLNVNSVVASGTWDIKLIIKTI